MISSITEKTIKQLKKSNLSIEDRTALTTALLDKLNALPIGDIIYFTQNGLMIDGKELDAEQTNAFKETCSALKDNFARKVIHEQIRHKATEAGIHKSQSIEELMFYKAAIWCLNEENILIQQLSEV